MEAVATRVKIGIYYKGARQTLSFYRTAASYPAPFELFSLAFQLFRLEGNRETLFPQAMYLDEDGDPVLFDPRLIPSGANFTLPFPGVAEPGSANAQPVPKKVMWTWDSKWNAVVSKYSLSEGDMVMDAPDYDKKDPEVVVPILISNVAFTSGKHEWSVAWKKDLGYQFAGVIEASMVENPKKKQSLATWGEDFRKAPLFHETSSSGTSVKFELDMDKKELRIDGKLSNERMPDKVYAAIASKHKNQCRLKL